jgi:hypothetical protein
MENNGGVSFTGWCRWIDADGQTHLCGHGQHVETAFTFHAPAPLVQELGVSFIAKEMILALLGEQLDTVERTNEAGEAVTLPTMGWSEEVRLNASIRHALKAVTDTGPEAVNAASLLGL